MNSPPASKQDLKNVKNSFDSQISNLLEEIDLSLKWDRPSILLAIYSSEVIGNRAQAVLKNQILSIGYKVSHIKIDKQNFDLGWFLSQFDQHERVIFFISGLRWGGGRSRTNAYQALNLRREVFVNQKMRMVIWLNPKEAVDLPLHAPDFWAFRHRVVEFVDEAIKQSQEPSKMISKSPSRHEILSWRDWQINETPDEINAKIKLRESLLAGMPVNDTSLFMRTELMYTLAYLYWNKGRFEKAENYLHQGLALAANSTAISMKSKLQTAIGILHHEQGKFDKAIRSYQNALETNPDDSQSWNNLGRVFMDSGRKQEALDAYKRSTKLNSRNSNAWNNLGNYYRLSGEFEKAIDAYKKSSKFEPHIEIPLINRAATLLDLGQPDKAIRALRKANRIDPSNVVTLMKLAKIYAGMNRFKDASTSYNKAIKEDPTYFPAYIGLISCDRAMKKPRAIKRHIAQALPYLDSQNALLQAQFEAQRGNNNEAIQLLKIALKDKLTTIEEVRINQFFNPIQEGIQSDRELSM